MDLPPHHDQTAGISRAKKRPRSKCAGFSLVEMMVAMVVIGIVLSSAFATVNHSVQTMEKARDYARVAQVLQSEMEDLRTMSFGGLAGLQTAAKIEWDGEFHDGWVELDLATEFNEAFGDRYRAFRLISDRYTDQKQVWIWVFWQRHNGTWQSKRSAALFTENGLHDYYYRSF